MLLANKRMIRTLPITLASFVHTEIANYQSANTHEVLVIGQALWEAFRRALFFISLR